MIRALQGAWLLGSSRSAWRFERALRQPIPAQQRRLKQILRYVEGSAYARQFKLDAATSIEQFRSRVPIVGWDQLQPWSERIAKGEQSVLTTQPTLAFERTGGSTGIDKRIPYTRSFKQEFSAALAPWMIDLFRTWPKLFGKRQYWSLSPAARTVEATAGGIPIGLSNDAEYFGPLQSVVQQLMAVPSHVGRCTDLDQWRKETWKALLQADDLGIISVWSPTFLLQLIDWAEHHLDSLLSLIPAHRAKRMAIRLRHGLTAKALWPQLQVISCWTEGFAAVHLEALGRRCAGISIQPKGLLATEGVVSFPYRGDHVLALTSHFLEFRDLSDDRMKLAHELIPDHTYAPVLTCGNGFLRYELPDQIRCIGYQSACPTIRFEHRLDRTSDLCGEKLTEAQVQRILGKFPGFVFSMLAPNAEHRGYDWWVESELSDVQLRKIGQQLDAMLNESFHYRYAREVGQLSALRVRRVTDGWSTREQIWLEEGRRLGDVKASVLELKPVKMPSIDLGWVSQ